MSDRSVFKTHGLTSLLLEAGLITQVHIDAALVRQRETGRRIGETLVEMGAVTEEDMGWALARQLGLPFVDIQKDALDAALILSFPEGLLHRFEVVPLVREEKSLSVALSDPTDGDLLDTLEKVARCRINPGVATRTAIQAALNDVLGPPRELRGGPSENTHAFDVVWDRSGASFLLFHLSRALKSGADELQFLPSPGELRVYYRAGGVLSEAAVVPAEMTYSLLARLSALGGPAIDDREQHVTGQVVCPSGQDEIVLDVSLLNLDHGVAVTLGLRRWHHQAPRLDELGMDGLEVARVRASLDDLSGLVLVSGPMRSGCSTTLSSLLGALTLEGRRVIAFEARQGPTWPPGVRMVLPPERAWEQWQDIALGQNADVVVLSHVLLGERIESALAGAGSGRLVLASTDWPDTFSMLDYLMTRPHLRSTLAARLRMVIQQRLAPAEPVAEDSAPEGPRPRALFEVLHVTEAMRALIQGGDPERRLRAAAVDDGLRPLAIQIRRRVADGVWSERDAMRMET